jgi:hypothetical protein
MMSDKIFSWLASAVVCSLILAAGCAPLAEKAVEPEVGLEKQIPKAAAEEAVTALIEKAAKPEVELEKQIPEAATAEAVTLALKFTPQDSTTYRVITDAQRSIKWKGPVPAEPAFKSGRRHNRIEMTFTQRVQSTDDKGNAVVKITIQGLKYYSMIKDKLVLDFDSSSIKDPNYPLALLIGQSYTIEIAPTGEVTEVIDVEEARTAVRRGSSVPKRATAMLRSDAIKERHGLTALPVTDKNQLRTGNNWTSVKTFSFGRMGAKSYEKIYTLKEIKDQDNRQIAIVEMNAIPTSEMAEQLYKQRETADFSEGFDNIGTYTGQLKLDLTTGKVEKYIENLQSEWIVAFPSVEQQDDEEPVVLTMSDTRLYSLEIID